MSLYQIAILAFGLLLGGGIAWFGMQVSLRRLSVGLMITSVFTGFMVAYAAVVYALVWS